MLHFVDVTKKSFLLINLLLVKLAVREFDFFYVFDYLTFAILTEAAPENLNERI